MHQWVNLTTKNGAVIQNPEYEQLRRVLQELFDSKIDNEHPDCWIECGTQSGELHTLSIYASGYAVLTKYKDFDMSEEIESSEIRPVDFQSAFVLWTTLIEKSDDRLV